MLYIFSKFLLSLKDFFFFHLSVYLILEGTARYRGQLLAPAEIFIFQPGLFHSFKAKKGFVMKFWAFLGQFYVLSSKPSLF